MHGIEFFLTFYIIFWKMFSHFLYDLLKKYVYAFYSLIALKNNPLSQNTGSTRDRNEVAEH